MCEWAEDQPKEPGRYMMRCMENDFEADAIRVFLDDGVLYAACPDLGTVPLESYHCGLTEITWKKVGSQNACKD